MSTETVQISLSMKDAEEISLGISDLLCWVRGYLAGSGDDTSNAPFGQEETRRINLLLKKAMNEAGNDQR